MTEKQLDKLYITKEHGRNRYWCDAIQNTVTLLAGYGLQEIFKEIYEVGIKKGEEIGAYKYACKLRELINIDEPS